MNNDSLQSNTEDIPVLPNRGALAENKFNEDIESEESIKKFGRFHFLSRTIWWFIAKTNFSSTVEEKQSGEIVERFTFFEISKVSRTNVEFTRIVIWKLMVSIAKS